MIAQDHLRATLWRCYSVRHRRLQLQTHSCLAGVLQPQLCSSSSSHNSFMVRRMPRSSCLRLHKSQRNPWTQLLRWRRWESLQRRGLPLTLMCRLQQRAMPRQLLT